jgi:DNA polymerase III epsilon subunit-like protein
LKKILYIDFEGSLSKGIREIGYLITEDEKITYSQEETGEKAISVLQNLRLNSFSYIAAHNSFIEKNLIKNYFPYQFDKATETVMKNKWLDTLEIYRKLYPSLEKYDLKSLIKTFISDSALKKEVDERCLHHKKNYHNSLFDAICVYLLVKRIEKTINLEHFLNYH